MSGDLTERAERFLVQCGAHDAGLPMSCACPDGDPRSVIADLLHALGDTERELADLRASVVRMADQFHGRIAYARSHVQGKSALDKMASREANVWDVAERDLRALLTTPGHDALTVEFMDAALGDETAGWSK